MSDNFSFKNLLAFLFKMISSLNIYASLFLCILLVNEVKCLTSSDMGTVVFVNILYRHGNRTPVDPYPNDPYRNISYWPVGWGQLTKEGMMGHYQLGKWLRQRYSTLLPEEYDRKDIFVQSTDVDRTLMSAASNLAGLYEPTPSKNWSPDIKWRPIPVHTIPEEADMVLAAKKHCPRYESELKNLLNSEKFQKILRNNKPMLDLLSNATGATVKSLTNVEYIYNTLFIESLFNFPLPSWTKAVFPQPMKTLADLSFSLQCYTPQLARLKIGPLLREMVTNMKKKAAGKLNPDRKLWIYSAHDNTVANLLQGLGTFNFLSPPYFSTVILELREKNADYFVAIYFRNSSLNEPYVLRIPGCTELCPLENFIHLLDPVLPVNWEEECQLSFMQTVFHTTGVGFMAYSLSVCLIVLLTVMLYRVCRTKNSVTHDFAYQSLSIHAS